MFAVGHHVSRGVHRKIIAGTLAAIALSLVSFWMWARTPQYAIRQIEKAIKVHDIQRFRKYVDLDGVAADLWVLVQLNAAADSGALGSALATTMAGPLQDAVKRTLTTMVESQWAGPPRIVYDFLDLESSYSGIEYVKRDGKLAVAGLRFTTPKRATKSRVYEIRMRDLGSHWQVAGLNLSQIVVVKSLRDAEELRRLNAEQAERAETMRAARQEAESERAARQKHAELTVKAASSLSMSLGERAVVGGLRPGVAVTMAVSQPAFDDIAVVLFSDSKAASTPSLVTIPKGESSVKFLVETLAVKTPVETRITAQAYGTERTVTLLIEPRPAPPPEKYTAYEDVYLDERAMEYHVSTCEAAKAAAKGQRPTWRYQALTAQGVPRAKDCANLPLPILNQQPRKR